MYEFAPGDEFLGMPIVGQARDEYRLAQGSDDPDRCGIDALLWVAPPLFPLIFRPWQQTSPPRLMRLQLNDAVMAGEYELRLALIIK